MRLEPRHGEGEPVGHGGPRDELAHAVHVEDEAALRPEPARVEVLGSRSPVSSQMLRITSMSPWGIFSSGGP